MRSRKTATSVEKDNRSSEADYSEHIHRSAAALHGRPVKASRTGDPAPINVCRHQATILTAIRKKPEGALSDRLGDGNDL